MWFSGHYVSELKHRYCISIALSKSYELLKLEKNKGKHILDKLSNPLNMNKGYQVFLIFNFYKTTCKKR